jgi:hypothetical protein
MKQAALLSLIVIAVATLINGRYSISATTVGGEPVVVKLDHWTGAMSACVGERGVTDALTTYWLIDCSTH